MALIPVIAVENWSIVLSLDVDDVSRMVVGWQCINNNTIACLVRLSNTGYSIGQAAPAGQTTTAGVPKNRQWSYDGDSEMTYELTSVR